MSGSIYISFIAGALLALLMRDSAAAQQGPSHQRASVLVFGSTGFGVGASQTFKADLHLIAGRHHEFTAGYNGFTRRTRHLPPDAEPARSFGWVDFNYPQETMSMFSLGYGYVFYPENRSDVLRYVIRVSGMTGLRRDAFNLEYHNHLIGSSYSYDEDVYDALGLLIEPCIQFTPARGFGLSAGFYGVFNDHFSGAGVNFALMFGRVGNRKYIRKPPTEHARARHEFRRKHPFRFYPKNLR